MKLTDIESKAKDFYDIVWSNPNKIHQLGKELLSWHYGFYEKGITNSNEAKINMMNYVGRLLELDDESFTKILDAGSGIGSTSIYLAKKYSNCIFYGITISDIESFLAGKLQKKYKIKNVRFQQGSYMKTSYSKNFFDRIFALESIIYAPDKREFLKEMYRILKPNGKIIILDIFPKKYSLDLLTHKIDNYLYQRKISKKNFNHYYIDIVQFLEFLKSENFIEIKIHYLTDSGTIKKFNFFISYFLTAFALLVTKLRTINKQSSLKYKFISPFILFILILYKFIMDISSSKYYSIEAIKQ